MGERSLGLESFAALKRVTAVVVRSGARITIGALGATPSLNKGRTRRGRFFTPPTLCPHPPIIVGVPNHYDGFAKQGQQIKTKSNH
ncbi:hypothetical protein R9208_04820 [Flammeovirgaceae bacterium SG7u.132]|nr:hypothetical protein [Flammeovirgaceae bacterium SG7u.132]